MRGKVVSISYTKDEGHEDGRRGGTATGGVTSMIQYRRGRRIARFCGPTCRDSLREDRRARVIHQAVRVADGSAYSVEAASLAFCVCAYCGAVVRGRSFDSGPTWPVPRREVG
jgi:hypothetical protein